MYKQYKLKVRRLHKLFRKRHTKAVAVGLVTTCCAGILIVMAKQPIHIDIVTYRPVLAMIADGESNGNYNAYYGNAQNQQVQLVRMPVSEVLRWQEAYIESGSPSSAVGRYQIIRPTLESLVRELGVDPSQPFDEAMQDRMAIALMERRGAVKYIAGDISRDEFAANIAQEWAALPKVRGNNPEQSYYAGDGLNKAHISPAEVQKVLDNFKTTHQQRS